MRSSFRVCCVCTLRHSSAANEAWNWLEHVQHIARYSTTFVFYPLVCQPNTRTCSTEVACPCYNVAQCLVSSMVDMYLQLLSVAPMYTPLCVCFELTVCLHAVRALLRNGSLVA